MEAPRISSTFTRTCQVTCFYGSGAPVHDAAFKKMFSHPLMIELLVRGHVPEWGDRIDYSTLEQLPPELVSESLQRRYPDMMWRARTRDGKSDLLILLEFQARPDRFMALRTTTYACLALEGLAERKALARDGRLPEVVSLVLHHGDRPWNAPVRLAELFGRSSPGVLVSRGFSGEQLEEAMTMGRVMTAFERGLEEMVSRGRAEGRALMLRQMAARKFGSETADELSSLLARLPDPERFD